jgi:hypothetical protein
METSASQGLLQCADVLFLILTKVAAQDPESIGRASCTCRAFAALTADETFWQEVCRTEWKLKHPAGKSGPDFDAFVQELGGFKNFSEFWYESGLYLQHLL